MSASCQEVVVGSDCNGNGKEKLYGWSMYYVLMHGFKKSLFGIPTSYPILMFLSFRDSDGKLALEASLSTSKGKSS